MSETFEIKEKEERVILLGVSLKDNDDTLNSLEELEDLVNTAGAKVVATLVQNREKVQPGTYIGKGKIEELKELVEELDATGVVCDDELSPAQLKNLEDALETKVVDRTVIILEIFANRAVTKEGKIQVELAQLKYRFTRLVGLRTSLSRLGGGIGSKGPGEKKLEMDRRLIKDRMAQLNKELLVVKSSRETTRMSRSKNPVPIFAIVGYTNAGKSTLLNTLTGANVLEEDKLFATLDPTTRNLKLESGQEILLTDTVGFIRKLPHHLIDAFRSTLEEAKYADVIIHVVDASNKDAKVQMKVVYDTLEKLLVKDKKIITVFNKQDKVKINSIEQNNIVDNNNTKEYMTKNTNIVDEKADYIVKISAKKQDGLEELLSSMEEVLKDRKVLIEKLFSYEEAGKIQTIRKYGQLLEEEYKEDGIYVKAYLPKEMYDIIMNK